MHKTEPAFKSSSSVLMTWSVGSSHNEDLSTSLNTIHYRQQLIYNPGTCVCLRTRSDFKNDAHHYMCTTTNLSHVRPSRAEGIQLVKKYDAGRKIFCSFKHLPDSFFTLANILDRLRRNNTFTMFLVASHSMAQT